MAIGQKAAADLAGTAPVVSSSSTINVELCKIRWFLHFVMEQLVKLTHFYAVFFCSVWEK